MRAERPRRGSALLDVVVALVVLAVSGTALVTMLGQTAHTLHAVGETDRQVRLASRELEGLVAWSRADLESRVGRTTLHGWALKLTQVSPDLFGAAISVPDSGGVVLETTVYRPDTTHASQ